jgi:putative transferase (TIGR04331 family)
LLQATRQLLIALKVSDALHRIHPALSVLAYVCENYIVFGMTGVFNGQKYQAVADTARCLVTTAIEATWPSKEVPLLFLGDWCLIHERKSAWDKRDSVVAPYHWDDRKKLHNDYLYLQSLHEELLEELGNKLNELHNVDHSLRYWRIVVGPWLGYFIQMLFDRWAMLRFVLDNNEIAEVRVLKRPGWFGVPNDMTEFQAMFVTDEWNELIYGQILDWMEVPVEKVSSSTTNIFSSCGCVGLLKRLKRSLVMVATQIQGLIAKKNEFFFISSYLGVRHDLLLQIKLGQIPKLWRPLKTPRSAFDQSHRDWRLHERACGHEFESLARALIPKNIPTAYVEGYKAFIALVGNLPWPKTPAAIFTSNSHIADDLFKAWAADKVQQGAPLIIGQHGGNYGMAMWSFTEDHQVLIADRFLTWGWSESQNDKITPVGNLKGFSKVVKPKTGGGALLVEGALPRQSYHMYSAPVAAGQWTAYFEDQCRFVRVLPLELRNKVLVRLYAHDYRHCQRQRWIERFPDLKVDNGGLSMDTLLKNTRIYISTYNATTYLESLSLNFPTIIFWNPMHWELRSGVWPYFEKLKAVGVFHETPESAAQQMVAVWDDVTGWWHSIEVQTARREFCERYAHIPESPLVKMAELFKSLSYLSVSRHLNEQKFGKSK